MAAGARSSVPWRTPLPCPLHGLNADGRTPAETMMAETDTTLTLRGLGKAAEWDYENGFHWFSAPARLGKLLAHYELYKMIADRPGDIVELGVFKANSLIRFATFRRLLENEDSRVIRGFDAFGKFPRD